MSKSRDKSHRSRDRSHLKKMSKKITESLPAEEDAVFVRAEESRYDDPKKKRWDSVQRQKGLVGAKMISNEIEALLSKAH